jgi:hypothetical protein
MEFNVPEAAKQENMGRELAGEPGIIRFDLAHSS